MISPNNIFLSLLSPIIIKTEAGLKGHTNIYKIKY